MYQMYLQLLKDVELQLRQKLEQSTEIVVEHIQERTCKEQDIPAISKKLESFKFHVQKYQMMALENFRANLKANVEAPVQSQTHYLSMKNQRQRSKAFSPDDLEAVIDNKIQASLVKQQQSLLNYMDTFDEEFKNQNCTLINEYEQIEQMLEQLKLKE